MVDTEIVRNDNQGQLCGNGECSKLNQNPVVAEREYGCMGKEIWVKRGNGREGVCSVNLDKMLPITSDPLVEEFVVCER